MAGRTQNLFTLAAAARLVVPAADAAAGARHQEDPGRGKLRSPAG